MASATMVIREPGRYPVASAKLELSGHKLDDLWAVMLGKATPCAEIGHSWSPILSGNADVRCDAELRKAQPTQSRGRRLTGAHGHLAFGVVAN